jgi:mRNA interferase RelE/StbE
VNHTLRILARAEKELGALDSKPYQAIKEKIYELGDNPRPAGCRKLTDLSAWRLRVGDYRVVYEINDKTKTVTVLRVGHRKDVYR